MPNSPEQTVVRSKLNMPMPSAAIERLESFHVADTIHLNVVKQNPHVSSSDHTSLLISSKNSVQSVMPSEKSSSVAHSSSKSATKHGRKI